MRVQKLCQRCGRVFFASTQAKAAMYCSAACRVAAYRARRRAEPEPDYRAMYEDLTAQLRAFLDRGPAPRRLPPRRAAGRPGRLRHQGPSARPGAAGRPAPHPAGRGAAGCVAGCGPAAPRCPGDGRACSLNRRGPTWTAIVARVGGDNRRDRGIIAPWQ